jgi:hypothetical protein
MEMVINWKDRLTKSIDIHLLVLKTEIDNIFDSMATELIKMARRDKFDIKIINVIWRIQNYNDNQIE